MMSFLDVASVSINVTAENHSSSTVPQHEVRPAKGLEFNRAEASRSLRGTVSRVNTQRLATTHPSKGDQREMGNEAAAAILVQTIILRDGRLQALMGVQACKGPLMAVEFIRPYYAAALAMITNVAGELALTNA
jgi:hypothetical protein